MYRLFSFALVLTMACKKDDGGPPTHATCQALDKRNIVNRLDQVVSDNSDILDLDGQCLEAVASLGTEQNDGWVYSIRFEPATSGTKIADFHIMFFLIPPGSGGTLNQYDPRMGGNRLSKAQCFSVPEDHFCSHIDDDSIDPPGEAASDDVDFRGKVGSLELKITDSDGSDYHTYEGDFELVAYAVSDNEKYIAPAIALEGVFHWQHPEGNW